MSPSTASPPPVVRLSIWQWMRVNLFNSWWNALLTVLTSLLVFWFVRGVLIWALNEAQWSVIPANLRLILVGQYPREQLWRVWIALLLLAFLMGNVFAIWAGQLKRMAQTLSVVPLLLALLPIAQETRGWLIALSVPGVLGYQMGKRNTPLLRRIVLIGLTLWMPVFILLLTGITSENGILPRIGTNLWGGLLLTMLLTIIGIVASFPIGVLLALGRRSSLPIVRWFCIAYIEIIRGVPLITILFMAQLMLPLFLPPNIVLDRVLRAQAGIILFSAAYLAENVRGGLQAIPKGQYEAAYALGLNGLQATWFIILPQALRLVIPVLVGQFIALFKDTSLVAIVGLFDLLGIAKTIIAQPEFLGLQREVYAFISVFYWVISYGMSYISQKVEEAAGLGKR